MKKISVIILLSLTLIQCKKQEVVSKENVKTETSKQESKTDLITLGCYIYDDKKSKIKLQITQKEGEIKGTLNYDLFEKDTNSGTFIGQINDSILIANYTFKSEGIESTREIAFKIKDNKLIEGFGQRNEDGTKFINPENLNFDNEMILIKTDCEN